MFFTELQIHMAGKYNIVAKSGIVEDYAKLTALDVGCQQELKLHKTSKAYRDIHDMEAWF